MRAWKCEKCGHIEVYEPKKDATASESPSVTSYDEIIRSIKNAPLTYLPAILMNTIEMCIKRKVFVSGDKLVDVVGKVVKKAES